MDLEQFLAQVIPNIGEENKGITPDYVRSWEEEERRIIRVYGALNVPDEGPSNDTVCIIDEIEKYERRDFGIPTEKRTPIVMFIDSPGGDEQGTMILAKKMRSCKTPINTVNNGHADSAGGILFMSGDKRFTREGSEAMIHPGSYTVSGNRDQAESAKKQIDKIKKNTIDHILANTIITKREYSKYASRDWYFDAEEQVKYGMADEILTDLEDAFKNYGKRAPKVAEPEPNSTPPVTEA